MATYTRSATLFFATGVFTYPASPAYPADLYQYSPDFFPCGFGPFLYGGNYYAVLYEDYLHVMKSSDGGLTWDKMDMAGAVSIPWLLPANASSHLGCVVSGSTLHIFGFFTQANPAYDVKMVKLAFDLATDTYVTTFVDNGPLIKYYTGGGSLTADTGLGLYGPRVLATRRSDGSFLAVYNQTVNISGTWRKKVYAVTLTGTTWGTPFSVDQDAASTMSYAAMTVYLGADDRTHVWMVHRDASVRHVVISLANAISSQHYVNIQIYNCMECRWGQATAYRGVICWPVRVWARDDPPIWENTDACAVVITQDGGGDMSNVEYVSLVDMVHLDTHPGGAWVNGAYQVVWSRSPDKALMRNAKPFDGSFSPTNTLLYPGSIFDVTGGASHDCMIHVGDLGGEVGVFFSDYDDTLRFTLLEPIEEPECIPVPFLAEVKLLDASNFIGWANYGPWKRSDGLYCYAYTNSLGPPERQGQVFRSIDKGVTWTPLDSSAGPAFGFACRYDPAHDRITVLSSASPSAGPPAYTPISLRDFDLLTNTWGATYATASAPDFEPIMILLIRPSGNKVAIGTPDSAGSGWWWSEWNGTVWSAPIRFTAAVASTSAILDGAAVDPVSGNIHLLWRRYNFSTGQSALEHRVLDTAGVLSSVNVLAASWSFGGTEYRDCESIAFFGGKVYLFSYKHPDYKVFIGSPAAMPTGFTSVTVASPGTNDPCGSAFLSTDGSQLIYLFQDQGRKIQKTMSANGTTWSGPSLVYDPWPYPTNPLIHVSGADLSPDGLNGIGMFAESYSATFYAIQVESCCGGEAAGAAGNYGYTA